MINNIKKERANCVYGCSTGKKRQKSAASVRQNVCQLRNDMNGIDAEYGIVHVINRLYQSLNLKVDAFPSVNLVLDRLQNVGEKTLVHVRPFELWNAERRKLKRCF